MKSLKNLYEGAKSYGSKALAGILLIGALSGCGNSKDFQFSHSCNFRGFYAFAHDKDSRKVSLYLDEASGKKLNLSDDVSYIEGVDKNEDNHFEIIKFNNQDVKFNKLTPYVNEDSLEVVYRFVLEDLLKK